MSDKRDSVSELVGGQTEGGVAFSGTAHGPGLRAAAWTDTTHLLVQDGVYHLFNANDDPFETVDLWAPDAPTAAALMSALDQWSRANGWPSSWEAADVDPATEEELRAMGYLR